MTKSTEKLPYLASAAAALIFGFSFLFTKNALDNLEIFQLLGLRFLIATLFLFGLKTFKVVKINLTQKKIKGLLILAILQPGLYFVCETIGIDLTSASEAGIMIALIPVVVAALASLLLKEKLERTQWLSVLASVFGVILLTLPKLSGGVNAQLTGTLALLGAVLAGSFYHIYSRKVSDTATPIESTYVMMWLGALFFNGIGIIKATANSSLVAYFSVFTDPSIIFAVLYLGVVSSVAAFFFMNYSLSKLPASRAAIFGNLTPVISIFAGVVFRGEIFLPSQLLGSIIILLSVWGVNRTTRSSGEIS